MSKTNAIYELLNKLDGNEGYIGPQRIRQLEEKLFCIIGSLIPDRVFRYRKLNENNINSFKEGTVYLSSPDAFNDPSDCLLCVNPESIMASQIGGMEKDGILGEGGNPTEEQIRTLDSINFGIDTIARTREGIKLSCFSERIDSPLMWAHYADEHKGFALSYNIIEDFQEDNCEGCADESLCQGKKRPFFPVIYKKKRPDSTLYALACTLQYEAGSYSDNHAKPLLPFLVKGLDWKYEKEWRCICKNAEKKCFSIKPNAIYLGMNMEKKIEKC